MPAFVGRGDQETKEFAFSPYKGPAIIVPQIATYGRFCQNWQQGGNSPKLPANCDWFEITHWVIKNGAVRIGRTPAGYEPASLPLVYIPGIVLH